MKRYQNPAIFEHLAMSYALGSLHGKARNRFETLMAQHLYLRAITDSYQQQLAPMAEWLPEETPPARVWDNIARQLPARNSQATGKLLPGWLSILLPWGSTVFASIIASVLTVLALGLWTPAPKAYMATLKSSDQPDKMMVAMVERSNMTLSLEMPEQTMPEESGMTPVLWCIPKNPNMPPMRMGELTGDHAHGMPIDHATWRDMSHIDAIAISLEPANTKADKPMGKIVFNGKLAGL